MLRKVFVLGKQEITRLLRKSYNVEFYNLNSSPDIVKVIKSRRRR
jgi:hypothetical protein